MGVGKTVQAIAISTIYSEELPVLILCPCSVKYIWRDELMYSLKGLKISDIQILKAGKDCLDSYAKFFIFSYDLTVRMEDKIINKKFKFGIADEAHYLKNRDSKRTKAMLPILQSCKRVLLITGTPILTKPYELLPLLSILRPDIFSNSKSFADRYCHHKKSKIIRFNQFQIAFCGIDWSCEKNTRELNFCLKNLMIRRLNEDVLSELPAKKRQKIEIKQMKKL